MKMFLKYIFLFISSIYITWQENVPPKEVSIKEAMALYEEALKEDVIPKDAIELKLIKKVPENNEIEEKEIFFRNLLGIFVDERGHIFAPDPALCIIYEFDEYGKYLNRYSKQGQGPGEFRYPKVIFFYKDENIVMDPMQSRLTYFNRKWEYIRSISLFGKYAIGVDNDGYIYCMNLRGENIISVLDSNGKLVKSFGRPLYPDKPNSILNMSLAAIAPNGTVWVGFGAVGIIHKYTKEGKLEKEINIMDYYNNKLLKKTLEQNIENDEKGKRVSSPIIKGIVPINEEIIVTRGGIVNLIFRIDSKGQYKEAYYVPPKFRIDKVCSHVKASEKGEEIFYLREFNYEDGDYSIGIYSREK